MRSLPARLVAVFGVLLVCSCGSDQALSPTAPANPARVAALSAAESNMFAVLTLRSGHVALEDVEVWVRYASNVADPSWYLGGTTDERGKCNLPVLPASHSGYFHFKAVQNTSVVGVWHSVPVNDGYETHLLLDTAGGRRSHKIPNPIKRSFVIPGGAEMEMVYVPAGSFQMGSDAFEAGREEDEGPQTGVRLTEGFYVSRFEVTQDQWTRVVGTSPWKTFRETAERLGLSDVAVAEDGPEYPAESVGWNGVQAFIDALNAHAGREIYRLPTEAEWEYFARAGSSTRWSFGDVESDLEDYGWTRKNTMNAGEPFAHPVGTKLPSQWGLYDVHGNVAEWVQDWYRPYSGGQLTDPSGPLSGIHADRGYRSKKVIRGGSIADIAPRSADRDFADTEGLGSGIGFRVVRMDQPEEERVRASHY